MKNQTTIILIFYLTNVFILNAQENPLHFEEYIATVKTELKALELPKTAVHPNLIDSNLEQIFSAVILNGNDLTNDGSAFSYTMSEDKTTLNLNAVFKLCKNRYIKGGIHGTSTNNIFNIYNNKSWSTNIGGNVGLIITFKNSQNFDEKETPKLRENRSVFMDSLQLHKVSVLNIELDATKEKIVLLENIIHLQKKLTAYMTESEKLQLKILTDSLIIKDILKDVAHPNTFNKLQELKQLQQSKIQLLDVLGDKCKMEKLVTEEILDFDIKNDITYGHNIHWFSVDFSFDYIKYNLNDSIITNLTTKKLKHQFSGKGSLHYNYSLKKKKIFVYTQAGFHIATGSYLDNPALKFETTPEVVQKNDTYYIKENGQIIGNYFYLREDQFFAGVNIYLAGFYGNHFGLNLKYEHHCAINRIKESPYQNNFTFLFGPLLKVGNKENMITTTFGLDIGYQNASYTKLGLKENFVTKIKIGIPFAIFNKPKI